MFSQMIFWLWFAGLMVLVAGLIAARRRIREARGLEKLVVSGPVCFAAPLAVFGAEHLTNARAISQIVPQWMPAHLFWTYLVGLALLAAAVSLTLNIYPHFTAALLGVMFVCFVLMIHIPNVVASPANRILWAVALRDLAFAGGALALAAMRWERLAMLSRVMLGVPLLFFAIEHFLHAQFAPGVPLAKVTPDWVPIRAFWGYLTGAALLFAGATLLVDWRSGRPRTAAKLLGLLITLLVLLLYLPIFCMAPPAGLLEGINYVADTLLFAGAVLLVAAVVPLG